MDTLEQDQVNRSKWDEFFGSGYQWQTNPNGNVGYTQHGKIQTETHWITINPYTKTFYYYVEEDSRPLWGHIAEIPDEVLNEKKDLDYWLEDEITGFNDLNAD